MNLTANGEANEMRSDYGLYIVAVICFIIAGIFLTGAIPDYTFADSMGMVAISIFLILGIIFAVTGYATKPKVTTLPIKEPQPTLAEPTPPPMPPAAVVMEEPVTQPTSAEAPPQETPTAIEEPAPPPPPPLASVEETAKTEEEKPPVEKPVRRRRKKTE
jgi:hypothetical protein